MIIPTKIIIIQKKIISSEERFDEPEYNVGTENKCTTNHEQFINSFS
jgi:hypothetical protein